MDERIPGVNYLFQPTPIGSPPYLVDVGGGDAKLGSNFPEKSHPSAPCRFFGLAQSYRSNGFLGELGSIDLRAFRLAASFLTIIDVILIGAWNYVGRLQTPRRVACVARRFELPAVRLLANPTIKSNRLPLNNSYGIAFVRTTLPNTTTCFLVFDCIGENIFQRQHFDFPERGIEYARLD